MANFYISDLHIGHENILQFDNRPFADVNEMNNKLIENWNARVRSDDTVYILGDFIWAKESEWPSIVGSLAGNKVLIRGNHDPKQFSAATKRMFQEITDLKEIKDSGKHVVMCHYPIPFFRAGFAPTAFMLYGHVHESKFYLIGEGHKEFLADKTRDLDYYVLALAAIARELNIRKMTCGKIRIAAGLPLTWVSGQRDEFRDYLLQNKAVDFSFRNVSYHVEIVGVDIFPQGFAAVADRLSDFRGVNMICDIGNGTMNIMFINDKKPVSGNMFTEKYGTHQCLLAVRENVMRAHHTTVDEAIINRVFRFGTADIKEDYLKTITDTATDYVEGIFQRLREHEYNQELMRLYVLGGGSCLIRNFGVYDASRVTINDDICATAKGYEYLAYVNLLKNGGTV